MKKLFSRYAGSGGGASQPGKDDGGGGGGGEEETEFTQLALGLLQDHRELQIRPPPVLPTDVVDPSSFPYYTSSASDTSDTVFVKQTGVDSQNAIAYIRDDWIRTQMNLAEDSFTTPHAISIFVSTFNVGGRKPEREIDLLLQNASRVDLIVLGLQEMVDLNVTNAMSDSASRERSQLWLDLVQRSQLFQQNDYVLLGSKYLVGIMLCVFVAKPLRQHVNAVQTTCVSTGAMGGLVGNKGGCSIRFELYDTSFCFTSAHLAAHVEGVDGRNSDVRNISQKTMFKLPLRNHTASGLIPEKHHSRIASTTPAALQRGELELQEHDYTVWLGDFNYRVDRASPEEVLDNIRDFGWLEARDQLRREMTAKRVFSGYTEVQRVQFPPTYKYEPGTDQYERRAEKKLRAPAWTDRVVWKHVYEANCLFYTANQQVRFSDHRPVECGLRATVRVVNDDARNFAYRTVKNKLEVVGTSGGGGGFFVSKQTVDFGVAVYRQVLCQDVVLRNDQTMPVVWRLVFRPDSPQWFTTSQAFGLLLPGESVSLEFKMEIGLDVARISLGQNALRDLAEIRVHPAGGVVPAVLHGPSAVVATLHTFFLSVRCEWTPSCFGANSVGSLLWATLPVAMGGSGETQFAHSGGSTAPLTVPKEVWRLVFRLQREVGAYRLFLMHGDLDECRAIRHCLDTGASFSSSLSVYSYASVLLELLDALAEPVVPVEYFPDEATVQAGQDPSWSAAWLTSLPTPSFNTLQLVLALVSKTLQAGQRNKVTLQAIAPVFAEVLFRPSLAANIGRENATMNATGFGEFASWLGGTSSTSSAGKAESSKSQAAVAAFTALLVSA
ncbi:hypothetical protein BASA81_003157 [Batrachochytrium salamandrivorans]|nr:hypothetical protein BASA81_003157 [Batrachochytrium salamandrivorans]